ncbi:helix-turn-helix domain-containing protein [Glycomyces salinus]|uniref:helix-turn-helix domain-containing protein n=1 Tax=Glycomyces salinus TaxID=980294 RepID=UPI0018EA447A|nr:helix-turn-helix transcriptional regulator [Glycomyces salinus]
MSTTPTPTLAKIALGALITRIREASGKDRGEVAEALGIDTETVRRWEIGKIAPKRMAIEAIARFLDASPAELSRMTTLSLESKQRGMFERNSVPPDLRVLYETEATARLIRSLELEYIPGLLQTPEYHLTAQNAQVPIDEGHAATLRSVRTRRQEIVFSRKSLPKMLFIIGRAALLYLDDLPEVKDGQIARLMEAAARPEIEIRVITGLHAAMLGSFTILTPQAKTGARPFTYVEDIDGGRYVEGELVSQYEEVINLVRDQQSIELEEYLQ